MYIQVLLVRAFSQDSVFVYDQHLFEECLLAQVILKAQEYTIVK